MLRAADDFSPWVMPNMSENLMVLARKLTVRFTCTAERRKSKDHMVPNVAFPKRDSAPEFEKKTA
jgi:hypothetical protein